MIFFIFYKLMCVIFDFIYILFYIKNCWEHWNFSKRVKKRKCPTVPKETPLACRFLSSQAVVIELDV